MTRAAASGRNRILPAALASCLVLLLLVGCARMDRAVPADLQELAPSTWRSLETNENKAQIDSFLSRYAAGTRQAEAARFLADNLPAADAASMTAAELTEHVEYAMRARMTFPWAASVPWDMFLRWVLPHRSAQEPAQPFRARLFKTLAPRMAAIASMEDAALELALWCQEKLKYVATQRRDAGPLTVLLRGRARCEEASILYCAAARTVGIPARVAVTPAWQFADDNHAWVEVWIHGEWHYLDPANPSPALDTAWFSNNAANAQLVTTVAYGSAPPNGNAPSNEPAALLRSGPGYTTLNITERYGPVQPLDVTVLGPGGAPLPHARVGVSIYNYASFRPAATMTCDEHGRASIKLGKGTVLLTVAHEGAMDYAVVRVVPGTTTATLDVRNNRAPDGSYFFGFGQRLQADTPNIPDARKTLFNDRKQAVQDLREKALALTVERTLALAAKLEYEPADRQQEMREAVDRVLREAGFNGPALLEFLSTTPKPHRVSAVYMLYGLWAADRAVPADVVTLRHELAAVLGARRHAENTLQLKLPPQTLSTLWPHLIAHRVTRYEPHSAYFQKLGTRFRHLLGDSAKLTAFNVARYTSNLRTVRSHALGPLLTPVQAVRLGAVQSELERAIACVAILRSLGIPARHYEQWRLTEFFDGEQWLPVHPNQPELTGNTQATPETARFYGAPSALHVLFTLKSVPTPRDKTQYYRDYTVSAYRPSKPGEPPFFRFHEPDNRFFSAEFDEKTGERVIRLPAGEYVLISGLRNKNGEPTAHVRPVRILQGQGAQGLVELDASSQNIE